MATLARRAATEFVAMTIFVWAGCASAVTTGTWLDEDGVSMARLLPISVVFGFTIMALVYATAHISGGHINPAVTIGLCAIKAIPPVEAAAYIAAQCVGAILGAALVFGSTSGITDGGNPPFNLGANGVSPLITIGNAFLLELMGTLILVLTVIMTAVDKRGGAGNVAPFAIGNAVLVAHVVLIPLTGCGINPARSLGPAVVNSMAGVDTWDDHYVYWVGPIAGALIAAAIATFIFEVQLEAEEEFKDISQDDDVESGATPNSKDTNDGPVTRS